MKNIKPNYWGKPNSRPMKVKPIRKTNSNDLLKAGVGLAVGMAALGIALNAFSD